MCLPGSHSLSGLSVPFRCRRRTRSNKGRRGAGRLPAGTLTTGFLFGPPLGISTSVTLSVECPCRPQEIRRRYQRICGLAVYDAQALVSPIELLLVHLRKSHSPPCRGEHPLGEWTLTVNDQGNAEQNGSFLGWSMNLWGECYDPQKAKRFELNVDDDDGQYNVPPSATDKTRVYPKPTNNLPSDHGAVPGEATGAAFPTTTGEVAPQSSMWRR